ncbi:hypothetical protein Tco_0252158, partial [Tanacetum coccineum]
ANGHIVSDVGSSEVSVVKLFEDGLESVSGFKWFPPWSTETSVAFRTFHKLLVGASSHSDAIRRNRRGGRAGGYKELDEEELEETKRRWREAEEDDGEMYDEFGNLKKKFRVKTQQAEVGQILPGTGRAGWEVEVLGMSDRDRRERSRDRGRVMEERENNNNRRRSRSRDRDRVRKESGTGITIITETENTAGKGLIVTGMSDRDRRERSGDRGRVREERESSNNRRRSRSRHRDRGRKKTSWERGVTIITVD